MVTHLGKAFCVLKCHSTESMTIQQELRRKLEKGTSICEFDHKVV
jgi:hypothetical protein